MAALNATEVRRESQALRADAARLREETRWRVRVTRRRLQACLLAYARASSLSAAPSPSPWSDLEWEPVAAAGLDQVLVLR